MAWVNYTYNYDMDNMRPAVLHAFEVLEAVKNATKNENTNFDVQFLFRLKKLHIPIQLKMMIKYLIIHQKLKITKKIS